MSALTDKAPLIPSTRSYITSGLNGERNRTTSQDSALLSAEKGTKRNEPRRTSTTTRLHHEISRAGNHAPSDDASWASKSSSSLSSLKSSGKDSGKMRGVNRLKEKMAMKWEARNRRIGLFEAWQRKLPVIEKASGDVRSADSCDGSAVKC